MEMFWVSAVKDAMIFAEGIAIIIMAIKAERRTEHIRVLSAENRALKEERKNAAKALRRICARADICDFLADEWKEMWAE